MMTASVIKDAIITTKAITNRRKSKTLGLWKIQLSLKPLFILTTLGLTLTACTRTPNSSVYLAIQANSPETALLTEDVIHLLSKRVKGERLIIDILKDNQAENIYSSSASRQDIKHLKEQIDVKPSTPELDPVPSTEVALISAIQRAKDLAIANGNQTEFHAYILTPGTTDAPTLRKMQAIWENSTQAFPQTMRIYLIGLTPENRVPTVSTLHPIASQAASAGTSLSEIAEQLKQF